MTPQAHELTPADDPAEGAAPVRKGLMFALSSPSGGGKTTLARLLLQNDPGITLSVSYTTRAPRPGEIHGKDYFFSEESAFRHKAAAGYFYEYAEVFGALYGTPKHYVQEHNAAGKDVLFDIDWQGTRRLTQSARADIVSVFILPPSLEELRRRLTARGQDSEDIIEARMARARDEISHWNEYDYVVVNDAIDATLQKILYILRAERLKRERRNDIGALAASLLGEG